MRGNVCGSARRGRAAWPGIRKPLTPTSARTTKFGFRIRTRHGLLVENLMIHGRDEADAERKLRQMYQHCEILDSLAHEAPSRRTMPSFEEVVSLLSK